MKLRERIAYIWEFYKFHVFIAVFLSFGAANLVYTIAYNNAHPVYIGINFAGEFRTDADMDAVAEHLRVILTDNGVKMKNKLINSYCGYINSDDLMQASKQAQQYNARYAAGELDLMIAPLDVIKEYYGAGHIMALDGELQDINETRLVYGEDGFAIAVMLPDGIGVDGKVMGLYCNGKHKGNAVKLLGMMIE